MQQQEKCKSAKSRTNIFISSAKTTFVNQSKQILSERNKTVCSARSSFFHFYSSSLFKNHDRRKLSLTKHIASIIEIPKFLKIDWMCTGQQ